MSSPTPGPWGIEYTPDEIRVGLEEDGRIVREAAVWPRSEDVERIEPGIAAEFEANARLVAAAPDLLEAADYLLSHDSKDPDDALDQATYIEAWEALKAAVYRARGEDDQ